MKEILEENMGKVTHDSETLAEGQQVISAVAIMHRVNDSGQHEIMLARRAATKKFLPGVFELPGGHIDFGETLHAGLKRELKEELNIDVKIGAIVGAFTYTNNVKKSHSIEVAFLAELVSNESEMILEPEDHSEVRWVTREQIPEIASERDADDPEHEMLKQAFNLLDDKPVSSTRLEELSGQATS